ncbi:MAG: lysophospholipid acyltransferase family protein [Butyricicoccaceae bacterium]
MAYIRGFQKVAIHAIHLYDMIKYNFHVYGRENMPEGGAVVCANHSQWADPPMLGVAIGAKHDIAIMAKKELFEIKGLGLLIDALGAFPVDRGAADVKSIKTAIQAVKDGKKLMIFPEGTTKNHGGEAKEGAAMIALRCKAPIVPVYITPDKKFRSRVNIIIGEPYMPERPGRGKDAYREVADDIMRRIYALKDTVQ